MGDSPLADITKSRNAILSGLEPEAAERIASHLTLIRSELGDPILEPGGPIEQVYFPETAMASAMGITAEGASAEVGVIGQEGLVGVPRLLGAETQPNLVNIQMAGEGWYLPARVAMDEFGRVGAFHRSVLRFVNELMMQMGRTAVCNAVHAVDQRLAKWLLMCHDRYPEDALPITQEFVATMVSTSRQSVSGAAQVLQERGLIRYSRGQITVIDRPGLESSACDCYQVVTVR